MGRSFLRFPCRADRAVGIVATTAEKKKRWARGLAGAFVVALVMGPGPGVYLVNPAPEEASPPTILGAPVLYVWAVFWFLVMAVTVFLAYKRLWSAEDEG